MMPDQQELNDTRMRLLNAAGAVFAEKGFQSATVREICHVAGVNLASVNYYFGDKEQLYIEAVRQARQMRMAQFPMPEYEPGTPASVRLLGFVRTMLSRMIDDEGAPWQSRLMMREILHPTKACQQMVEEHFRPHFELLLEILSELVPAATPRRVREQIAFSIVGQCLYYRVAQGVVDLLIPQDRLEQCYSIEALADHITRFSLAAMTPARYGPETSALLPASDSPPDSNAVAESAPVESGSVTFS